MILTFSQERKGVTATFREESSGRCDQMVVRPNAKAAKTLTPQCDLSPIWNLCWIISKDGTYVLAPEHDAAQVQWGGDWRMPTRQEFDDLNNKCDWIWTTMNGVYGYIVRGRGSYASNSIFLPCAGGGYGPLLYDAGSLGSYLSSVPDSDDYGSAWGLGFNSRFHLTDYGYRYYGESVRPLQGFTK